MFQSKLVPYVIQNKVLSILKFRIQPMSLYEEKSLFCKLHLLTDRNSLDPKYRRLYRKLSLRKTKRSIGMEPFNFDHILAKINKQELVCEKLNEVPIVGVSNVLDRFQKGCSTASSFNSRVNISFRMRLLGTSDQIPQPFVSPYTGR